MKKRVALLALILLLLLSMIGSLPITTQAQELTTKGSLRIGVYGVGYPGYPTENETLNPLLHPGSGLYFPNVNKLTRLDENGTVIPDLADSWELIDNTTWRFNLNNTVTWHDSNATIQFEFNASDVKYTLDTMLTHPNVSSYWTEDLGLRDIINSTEIINATTIDIHTNEPFYLPIYLTLPPMMPAHLYNGTDLLTNPYNYNPIGTGPFKFVTWTPGANITLDAYGGYFRGVSLERTTIRWDLSYEETADALKNNEIDLVPLGIDPHKIEELQAIPGISSTVVDSQDFFYLAPNLTSIIECSKGLYPILNDTDARRAIADAINKTEIIEEVFLNYATEASSPIPPIMKQWYNPNVQTYGGNPQQANETFDNIGYTVKLDGWRFNITIKCINSPRYINISNIIKDNLEKVKVGVEVIPRDFDTELIPDLVTGNFTMILWRWWYEIPDPSLLYNLYHTNGVYNQFYGYSNATIDNLLEQLQTTLNETEREQICDDLQVCLAEDLPNIFLVHTKRVNNCNNDFHGFIATPSIASSDTYSLENVYYQPTASGEGQCSFGIRFINDQGNTTGYYNGESLEEIPNSSYTGVHSDPQVVKIRLASGNYTVELVGLENGTYELEIVNIAMEYKHVYIMSGFISEGEVRQFNLWVFSDGSILVFDPKRDIIGPEGVPDGIVNMRDIGMFCDLFMTYDPQRDINGDEVINMRDIGLVCNDFQKKWPPFE